MRWAPVRRCNGAWRCRRKRDGARRRKRLTSRLRSPHREPHLPMSPSLEPQVLEAFRAESRRVIARRGPYGIGLFLGLVAAAGLIEVAYYPERTRPLVWSLVIEAALCVAGLAARRIERLERYIIGIVTCMT